MRILDADALLKMINSKKGMIGCTGLRNYINFMAKDDKDIVKRVRGQWIKVSPMVDTEECSICRYNILSEELETPFCPWCGADMRGEDDG